MLHNSLRYWESQQDKIKWKEAIDRFPLGDYFLKTGDVTICSCGVYYSLIQVFVKIRTDIIKVDQHTVLFQK
jgi:acetone carboxylase gamma subunit